MKKLLLAGFCLVILSACNGKVDSALRGYVTDKLTGNKGTFKLSDYKEVNWDKVYVLGPFSNPRILDATLKPYQKEIMETGINTDDRICMLMLFNGTKLVSHSVFDRKNVDFSSLARFGVNATIKPYSKNKANFVYTRAGKYEPFVLQEF